MHVRSGRKPMGVPRNGMKEELGNNRPVSLTSNAAKMMERIILEALSQDERT